MNCDEVRSSLDALLDNELPEHDAKLIGAHLKVCSGCQSEFEELNCLHDTLTSVGRFIVPDSLTHNVKERLDFYIDRQQTITHQARGAWSFLSHAGAAVFGGAVVVFSSLLFHHDTLEDELLSLHVQSLGQRVEVDNTANKSGLVEIRTNNTHTVKPWFAGKVDFSPAVIDLKEDGFPLVGARLEKLNDRAVAALVYMRRKHIINLFVDVKAFHENQDHLNATKNGYSMVNAEQGDFVYWAVSDISSNELNEFLAKVVKKAVNADNQ